MCNETGQAHKGELRINEEFEAALGECAPHEYTEREKLMRKAQLSAANTLAESIDDIDKVLKKLIAARELLIYGSS
jgi:hypothetical protein